MSKSESSRAMPIVGGHHASCFSCQNRSNSEWCTLADDDLRYLDSVKTSNSYLPGQQIFYQGNPCLGIFCVESGTVVLRKSDASGNEVITRMVSGGETLGYRSYFGGGPYQASAEAIEPVQVCFIDRDAVSALLQRNPSIGLNFLRRLAGDLERAEDEHLNYSAHDVRTRLAHLLLSLKDRFSDVDDDGRLIFRLPLSRQDMASMLGTRPETVARTIRKLEDAGVAVFDGRRVVVDDLDLLLDEVEPVLA